MTTRIPVKPGKPGLIVRDPRTTRALPQDGGMVPDNSFWRRRIRSKDAVELTAAEWAAVERARAESRRKAAEEKARAESAHDTPASEPENG